MNPDDGEPRGGENPVMARKRQKAEESYPAAVRELLRRIDERMGVLKLNDRAAAQRAGLGTDWIRDIRRRGHPPRADKLAALADVLGVPASYLLQAIDTKKEQPTLQPVFRLGTIFVKGEVQAGVWREAVEWVPAEWLSITAPVDDRFPNAERFGLLVRGSSMDELYPDGTIVIVVRFEDVGRPPLNGERVVVLRRSRDSAAFEATLKEYERDTSGRHILWPRSHDPDFQSPFILNGPTITIGSRTLEFTSGEVRAGRVEDDDLTVSALVIGSYRPELSARR